MTSFCCRCSALLSDTQGIFRCHKTLYLSSPRLWFLKVIHRDLLDTVLIHWQDTRSSTVFMWTKEPKNNFNHCWISGRSWCRKPQQVIPDWAKGRLCLFSVMFVRGVCFGDFITLCAFSQYFFGKVSWVAPFGKELFHYLTACNTNELYICKFSYFSFWFRVQDIWSGCVISWLLIFNYFF